MDDSDSGDRVDAQWHQVAQRHHDSDGDIELTTDIVFAIAEAEGVPPVELKSPPLYECIDVSALEAAFFGPAESGRPRRGDGFVEFKYNEYCVKVNSDGWIQVYTLTRP